MAKSLGIRKGDRVKVIAGKDRGAVGEVLRVLTEENRVVVQGVNIVKRHVKDSVNQVTGQQVKGGIISSEAPIHVSNVQILVRDAEGNEVLTRVGRSRTEATKHRADGSEYSGTRGVRVARKTGEEIR